MRHISRKIILAALPYLVFGYGLILVFPVLVNAQSTAPGSSTTTTTTSSSAAVPKLAIPIPNLRFSNITISEASGENFRTIDVPWIVQYINAAYKWAVGAGAVIAASLIMIGGFQYMTAGGDASRVSAAKERISNAVIGLFLTIGAFIILQTVNPDLTNFSSVRIRVTKREVFTAEEAEDHGDTDTPGGTNPRAACRTIETCRELCNQSPRPTSHPGVMDASLARPIPTLPGLNGNGKTASQAVIDGLTRAATIANAQGLTIRVTSGFRPFSTQLALVCRKMGNPAAEATIGSAVAWPGGSNHGAGFAVDIQLLRGSTVLVGSGSCSRQREGTLASAENSQLFDQIMTAAGAKRYKNEVWHYEFGSSASCRCTAGNCPSPPMGCSGNC